MSKKKYTKEFKLKLVKEHTDQGVSFWRLGKNNGIEASIIRGWCHTYEAYGEAGLDRHNSNLCNYSADFKQRVVEEYLEGGISQQALAKKYGIYAPSTISCWVKSYNSHEELKESRPKGDYPMAKNNKSRKTTLQERISIVEYCIANSNNYALAAKGFNCSYGQVYTWVKKYDVKGVEGLYDRRGRNKPEEEFSDMEKLQAENRMLKAKTKQQQMEIDFLKKLDAVERR